MSIIINTVSLISCLLVLQSTRIAVSATTCSKIGTSLADLTCGGGGGNYIYATCVLTGDGITTASCPENWEYDDGACRYGTTLTTGMSACSVEPQCTDMTSYCNIPDGYEMPDEHFGQHLSFMALYLTSDNEACPTGWGYWDDVCAKVFSPVMADNKVSVMEKDDVPSTVAELACVTGTSDFPVPLSRTGMSFCVGSGSSCDELGWEKFAEWDNHCAHKVNYVPNLAACMGTEGTWDPETLCGLDGYNAPSGGEVGYLSIITPASGMDCPEGYIMAEPKSESNAIPPAGLLHDKECHKYIPVSSNLVDVVGLAVGIPIAFCCCCACIGYFFYRRRQKAKEQDPESQVYMKPGPDAATVTEVEAEVETVPMNYKA